MNARRLRAFESPDIEIPGLAVACRLAVEEGGVTAAAILDSGGSALAVAGAFADGELLEVGSAAAERAFSPGLLARLIAGETLTFGSRRSTVSVAAGCLFVVVVDDREAFATRKPVSTLRTDVERMVADARGDVEGVTPPPSDPDGSPGSGSGPAVELGITVPRNRLL